MSFIKLPSNAKILLDEIIKAENATQLLSKKFDNLSSKEDDELRAILRQLREAGYINVTWADNKPYQVIINNSARVYDEQLAEYEEEKRQRTSTTIITDNSINIGDGNKIKNSTLIGQNNQSKTDEMKSKKSFIENHPLLINIIISLIIGLLLMFSFWEDLINWIERLL